MISSPEFAELCIICGKEVFETLRAAGELSIEMANAYGIDLFEESYQKVPGISAEEIEIRKHLNRIKRRHSIA